MPRRALLVTSVFGLLLAPAAFAQDASPVADAGDATHPAHIHAGTCADPGDVAVPLADVADPAAEPGAEVRGAAAARPVEGSFTTVDVPLDELLAGPYAVNVHLSAEEIGTSIACGDIGGAVSTFDDGRTTLVFGLGEMNGSGHVGVVWMGEDGEQTEVNINLVPPAAAR